jgi:hypothetical protein
MSLDRGDSFFSPQAVALGFKAVCQYTEPAIRRAAHCMRVARPMAGSV